MKERFPLEALEINDIQKENLKNLTKDALIEGLQKNLKLKIDINSLDELFREDVALNVVFGSGNTVVGRSGQPFPSQSSLGETLVDHIFRAGFKNKEFNPISFASFDRLDVHLSIFSLPERIYVNNEQELARLLVPKRDGLILQYGEKSAYFIPDTWKIIPDPMHFILCLKQDAELNGIMWSSAIKVYRFYTQIFYWWWSKEELKGLDSNNPASEELSPDEINKNGVNKDE